MWNAIASLWIDSKMVKDIVATRLLTRIHVGILVSMDTNTSASQSSIRLMYGTCYEAPLIGKHQGLPLMTGKEFRTPWVIVSWNDRVKSTELSTPLENGSIRLSFAQCDAHNSLSTGSLQSLSSYEPSVIQ